MLLSKADIRRLEKAGYDTQGFVRYDRQGYAKLRNRRGYCVFYDVQKHRCKVYKCRPSGCRIYPVIYSVDEGIIVDDLCPESETASMTELEIRGRKVKSLLRNIDREAKVMGFLHKASKQS
jgi:hypothetical protein